MTPKPSFTQETGLALQGVRSALADFVAAVPGNMRRPTDLQKALGLDSKICWQIFNVIRGDASIAPAIHVPTLPALRRAMASAESVGVPHTLIQGVRQSLQDFEKVVEAHAGARPDFDAMVAAVAPNEQTEQIELKHRRSVYRGLSHIWGTQIDVLSTTTLLKGNPDGSTDRLILSCKHGLRRLRPDANIRVYGYRLSLHTPATPSSTVPIEPGTIERYGAPLMPEFCSQPLPEFRMRTDEEGWSTCELAGRSIGRLSEMDLAFATVSRSVETARDTDGRRWLGSNVLFNTPTGLLVSTLLVHRPTFGEVRPELLVFAHAPGSDAPSAVRSTALPLRERIAALGSGDRIGASPDEPRLQEMLRTACDRVAWDPREFDAFQVRVQFPVLHSVVRISFFLDEKSKKV
ncbi:MAG: hypothetical protein EA378_08790 [Phycisphaerales bacterium]|nr:MAG: hypothetical protein EA378_08790 [Phycisphaerales bacterium]